MDSAGIDYVWLLLDDHSRYWKAAEECLKRLVPCPRVKILRRPVHGMTVEDIWSFFCDLRRYLESGARVSVACWQSRHRSVAALVLFFMAECMMTLPQAVAIVSAHPLQRFHEFNGLDKLLHFASKLAKWRQEEHQATEAKRHVSVGPDSDTEASSSCSSSGQWRKRGPRPRSPPGLSRAEHKEAAVPDRKEQATRGENKQKRQVLNILYYTGLQEPPGLNPIIISTCLQTRVIVVNS